MEQNEIFSSFSANYQQHISWKPVLDLKLLNDWQADTQTQRFCLNYMFILCGCYKECAKTFVFWHSDTTGCVMKHNVKLKGFWNEGNKWEHVEYAGKPGVKHKILLCGYIIHAYKCFIISPYLWAACFDTLHFFGYWGFQSHVSLSDHVTKQHNYQQKAISYGIYILTMTKLLLL